jgi:hypothetical protein
MNSTPTTAWSRLQALSCEHNARLFASGQLARMTPRGVRGKSINVNREIQENVDILGRGNEEEIKARVLWYVTFEPAIFDTCSKANWQIGRGL